MADIKTHLNNIKGALYGKDVRGSIHDGIDAINKEVENTTDRQVDLENTFDQLVINAGNSNAEIVDARVKNDGTSYSKLGDRLDGIDSQLAYITNLNILASDFNIDKTGEVDSTDGIQNAINEAIKLKKNFILPPGTYKISKLYINKNDSFEDYIKLDFSNANFIITGSDDCCFDICTSKFIKIEGLNLINIDRFVNISGLWKSELSNCKINEIRFNYDIKGASGFDQCYWNTFSNSVFNNIKIYTGTKAKNQEFNANNFYSCNIGNNNFDFAIEIYGEGSIQGCSFDGCDISYAKKSIFKVEKQLERSYMNLYSCYLDSQGGVYESNPYNLIINQINCSYWGSSTTYNNLSTENASSQVALITNGTVEAGGLIPSSNVNLVKNGDFKINKNVYVYNGSSVIKNGGINGNILNVTMNKGCEIIFNTIEVPYNGNYSIGVIGRVVDEIQTKNIDFMAIIKKGDTIKRTKLYADNILRNEFTTVYAPVLEVEKGETIQILLKYRGEDTKNIELSYVGCTYGLIHNLFSETNGYVNNNITPTSGSYIGETYIENDFLYVWNGSIFVKTKLYSNNDIVSENIHPKDGWAYDIGLNNKPFRNGYFSNVVSVGSGATSGRPTDVRSGSMWFDNTLSKPIWFNGARWVDANGTTV